MGASLERQGRRAVGGPREELPHRQMLPDDTFEVKLAETMATVRAWSGFVADVADVEDAEIGDAWHFGLVPHMAGACPVEVVVRRSDQRCDFTIAGESYEDIAIADLDLLPKVLAAVADGRVIRRHGVSRATGLKRFTATIVRLPDGGVFEMAHPSPGAPAVESEIEWRDWHFLPYRR
ncbi:MAG TPA: hypothetical protein VNK52_04330 [Hyphomicrobiaceae bacterium]|nr:hypothetical protein [Hyphomicrobiaceae bacterium]